MATIDPHFLDEIRARVSLAEVVGRKVKLTKKGREYMGLCPFHSEKTPSFTVVEEKGFFHCFGCGAHGDAIGFEMQANNLSFPEAVEKLAGVAGLEVPKSTPEEAEKAKRRATLYEVMDLACAFYEKTLRMPQGKVGLDYLRKRGLDDGIVSRFRLGYAPSGATLKAQLAREGVDEALMVEAGLIVRPDDGRPAFDYFRDRVMFPITDRRGRVIAFGARVMGDAKPKYLNSPDTPIFHKGSVLYGLAQARASAHDHGAVIVTEGYMDVIALHRGGFHYAVAPLGTALTETQLEELWKLAPEPTLCFDGDAAGQRAAQRAATRALPIIKPGVSLRFAMLPPGQDPDDMICKQGAEAMRRVLDEAMPLADAVWIMAMEGHRTDTPERRAKFEHDLFALINQIADETVLQHYRQLMRQRLWDAFNRRPRPTAGRGGRGERADIDRHKPIPGAPPKSPRTEDGAMAALCGFLLDHPHVLERHLDEVTRAFDPRSGMGILVSAAVEALTERPDLSPEALRETLTGQGHGTALAGLRGATPASDGEAEEEFKRMVATIQEAALVREMQTIQDELRAAAVIPGDSTQDAEIGESVGESAGESLPESAVESLWERYRALHEALERLRGGEA